MPHSRQGLQYQNLTQGSPCLEHWMCLCLVLLFEADFAARGEGCKETLTLCNFWVTELRNNRIMEWFWFKWFKTHPVPPPAMGRDTFHYPRLLQALSSLALGTSRDGEFPSLGSRC